MRLGRRLSAPVWRRRAVEPSSPLTPAIGLPAQNRTSISRESKTGVVQSPGFPTSSRPRLSHSVVRCLEYPEGIITRSAARNFRRPIHDDDALMASLACWWTVHGRPGCTSDLLDDDGNGVRNHARNCASGKCELPQEGDTRGTSWQAAR